MSEENTSQPTQPHATAAAGPTIRVLSQYTKDLSFENPAAGTAAMSESPGITIGVDVNARGHAAGEGVFEVALRLSAHAKSESDEPLFVCELIYGGIFELLGVSDADAEALLLIECPRLLFPFARQIIATVTREGGFPPLMVDPIDFIGLYRQKKERAAQAADTEEGESQS
jgi:preprotein translocase subunit SecB